MSVLNRNQPLFTELTTDQAASIQGGFFKKLSQQVKKFSLNKLPRFLRPVSPIAKPVVGLGADSPIAKPIGKVIDSPEP